MRGGRTRYKRHPDKSRERHEKVKSVDFLESIMDISTLSLSVPPTKDKEKQKAFIKKRNLSALSLFLKDWTHKEIYIVPDPVDEDTGSFNIRCLIDTSTGLFFAIILLTLVNFSILYYLLVSLGESFISSAGRQFYDDNDLFLSLWAFVGIPAVMSFVMLVLLALAEYADQSNSKIIYAFLVFVRIVFYGCSYALLIVEIKNWALDIPKLSAFLQKYVNDSFNIYIDPNHTEHSKYKKVWEYTQRAFECCGKDSYNDFLGTYLQSKGLQYCQTTNCGSKGKTFLNPRIVPAFPRACCNPQGHRICASNPRSFEVYKTGCMKRATIWLHSITYMVLGSNALMVLFGVANLIFLFLIDRKNSQLRKKRKEIEERRKYRSLGPKVGHSKKTENKKSLATALEEDVETIMKPKSPETEHPESSTAPPEEANTTAPPETTTTNKKASI